MHSDRNTARRAWYVLIAVVATAVALVVPARVVLGREFFPQYLVFDLVVTVLFGVDAWLSLRTMVRPGRRKPFLLYASDIIAAIPFDLLTGAWELSLLRLLKLARVAQLMRKWRHAYLKQWNTIRLVYIVYWLALLVHWFSTGWLALRGIPEGTVAGSAYLSSLYWCVTTLATVGYGDITPETNAEMIYAIVIMILGVGMYGYVIGNVATIITQLQPARARYHENMEKLSAFMQERGIPSDLRRRIRDYYAYVWDQRLGYDESTIVSGLPPSLMTELSLYLKRDVIQKVPFFQGASEDLIREIALKMRPVVFTPGDFVFRAGETGKEMFFIGRGRLEVLSRDGGMVHAVLGDGDFFGEMALLSGQPRTASVRAVGYCDLYALDKETFDRILRDFPDFSDHIRAMALDRSGRGS